MQSTSSHIAICAELICGMIAGAVLAKLADGLVFDEESGEYIDGNKALEIAKQLEKNHL